MLSAGSTNIQNTKGFLLKVLVFIRKFRFTVLPKIADFAKFKLTKLKVFKLHRIMVDLPPKNWAI